MRKSRDCSPIEKYLSMTASAFNIGDNRQNVSYNYLITEPTSYRSTFNIFKENSKDYKEHKERNNYYPKLKAKPIKLKILKELPPELNNTIDDDFNNFKNCYNNEQEKIPKLLGRYSKSTTSVFRKSFQVTKDESIDIKRKLKIPKKLKAKLNVSVPNEQFSNPKNALEKLKLNKALILDMHSTMCTAQVESFREKIRKLSEERKIISKMPNARVTNLRPKESEIDNIINDKASIEFSGNRDIDILARAKFLKENTTFFTKFLPQRTMVPNSRCHPTFTPIKNLPNTFLLFGGLSTYTLFDFWLYNTKQNSWTLVKPKGEQFLPRYGHSAVYYKKIIYIFGGNILKNIQMAFEDIIIYNTVTNTIKGGEFKNNIRYNIIKRRHHISEVIGSAMIVHGGIDNNDETNKPLSAFHLLDLINLTWSNLYYDNKIYKNQNIKGKKGSSNYRKAPILPEIMDVKLAYHSSCSVISKDNEISEISNVYHFITYDINGSITRKNEIKYEGIYMFGGINEYGEFSDNLYILQVGCNPCIFFKPKIDGIGPCKRFSCSMNFYSDLNFVIIYGGKAITSFNDMFILDVVNLNWIKIDLVGVDNIPRAEAAMGVDGNKVYIFGGCNEHSFLSAKIFVVDLDFFKNKKKKNIYYSAKEKLVNFPEDTLSKMVLKLIKEGKEIPKEICSLYE